MSNFLNSTPFSGFFYDDTKDKRRAEEGLLRGEEAYQNLQTPNYQPVNYTGPEEAADVSYQDAEMERLGPTAYGDIAVDPRLKASRMAQLSALEELRQGGGMNAADRANLARIANEEATKARGGREAIMQQAQARGTGGSNLTLMNMLMENQGAANRQSQRDLDVAGMAQNRALEAGNQAANLAGNMSQQEFNQQAQVAAARDAAAKFNAQQFGQNSQFNTGNQLRADMTNQSKTQGVYDKLANAKMQQEQMNKYNMPTSQFQAQQQKAAGISGAGAATAKYYGDQLSANKKQQSGLWDSAGELVGAGMKMFGGMAGGGGGGGGGSKGGGSSSALSGMGGAAAGGEGWNNSPAGQEQPFSGVEEAPTNYVEARNEEEFKPYKGY